MFRGSVLFEDGDLGESADPGHRGRHRCGIAFGAGACLVPGASNGERETWVLKPVAF